MLRMAKIIYIPQQSAALEPILLACSLLYRWYERVAITATYVLYKPIYEITFGFIPMVVTWLILFLGSSIISFGISSLWWIHFIAIRWRLLSWEGHSLCEFSITLIQSSPIRFGINLLQVQQSDVHSFMSAQWLFKQIMMLGVSEQLR